MIDIKKLIELNDKYPSDKGLNGHDYWPAYSKFLPNRCRSLLEIGVAEGHSLNIWNDLYGQEEIDIHCLDLFDNYDFVGARWCRNRGFFPIKGDQSDIELLRTIKTKYNVLIDDGSHSAHHMLISFKELFWSNTFTGSLYVIEDLACNRDDFYWGGLVDKFEKTPLWMFKNFKTTGKIENPYFNHLDAAVFEKLISRVEVVDDAIAFIWRK